MFRSVRPYLERAGLEEPVVCYQGAVVAEPATGRFLRHVSTPTRVAQMRLVLSFGRADTAGAA